MVSPFSGWVLGGAALFSSPAWHAALVTGTLTLETAATRFGIALVVVWVGLSMLSSLVRGTSAPPERSDPDPHAMAGVAGPARPADAETGPGGP
jgi:hypothetical protein